MKHSPGQPTDFLLPNDDAVDDDIQLQYNPSPTTDQDIHDGVPEADHAEVADREESLRRRMADRRLVAQLSREEFTGELYNQFTLELTRYGLSVMRAWLHTGHISVLLRQRGAGQGLSEDERSRVLREPHLLDDLAYMTVAAALHNFKKRALQGGQWRDDGGAQLTTYFMGACILAFAGELKRMRTESKRLSRELLDEGAIFELNDVPSAEDPERTAVVSDLARGTLTRLKPKERAIVRMVADGYEYEEIAEALGPLSARSIEGTVYRMRQRLDRENPKEDQSHGF